MTREKPWLLTVIIHLLNKNPLNCIFLRFSENSDDTIIYANTILVHKLYNKISRFKSGAMVINLNKQIENKGR